MCMVFVSQISLDYLFILLESLISIALLYRDSCYLVWGNENHCWHLLQLVLAGRRSRVGRVVFIVQVEGVLSQNTVMEEIGITVPSDKVSHFLPLICDQKAVQWFC